MTMDTANADITAGTGAHLRAIDLGPTDPRRDQVAGEPEEDELDDEWDEFDDEDDDDEIEEWDDEDFDDLDDDDAE